MTSTSAVGTGVATTLGKPVRTDADIFYRRHRHMSASGLALAFSAFTKAREYKQQESQLLQGILIQDYGLLGLSQRLIYG